MNPFIRLKVPNRRDAVLATLAAVAFLGCRGNSTPETKDANAHEGHVHHEIPEHKPKGYPDAVRALKAMNSAMARKIESGSASSLLSDQTLARVRDIADWLPEIAADSDMPEDSWNDVEARSKTLVEAIETLRRDAASDLDSARLSAAIKIIDGELAGLDAIVARAGPGWFDNHVGINPPH